MLRNSTVQSDGGAAGSAGSILVNTGGTLALIGSFVSSDALGDGNAGGISLLAENALSLDQSFVTSKSFGSGGAGFVTLSASDILALDGSTVTSDAFGNGAAGAISLFSVGTLVLNESAVTSDSVGNGTGGAIFATADQILGADSLISSDTFSGGAGGSIQLTGGSAIGLSATDVSSSAFGAGDAGSVSLDAPAIRLVNGSAVTGNSIQSGISGIVSVQADTLLLDNSRIASNTARGFLGQSNFGLILVQGLEAGDGRAAPSIASLLLANGASIESSTTAEGDGGNINVTADRIALFDSRIIAQSCPNGCIDGGPAGNISITTGGLSLTDTADGRLTTISTDTNSNGNAGLVSIGGPADVFPDLALTGPEASISSNTSNSGDAGNIVIVGNMLTLADGAGINSGAQGDAATGNAGNILIALTDALSLTSASIATDAAAGNGGNLSVAAGGAISLDASRISSNASGTGNSGIVNVTGARVSLSDSAISADAFNRDANTLVGGNANNVTVNSTLADIELYDSFISADAGDGVGGLTTVASAADLLLDFGSYISADAFGAGKAGSVGVTAAGVDLRGGSFITSNTFGSGNAGDVMVDATALTLIDQSYIASNGDAGSTGNGGNVFVTAANATLRSGAYISTDALGEGDGGRASVTVSGMLALLGDTTDPSLPLPFISSDAKLGTAGGVLLQAGEARLVNSYISSDLLAQGDGAAGDVIVNIVGSIDLRDSFITSRTLRDSIGPGGNVFVSANRASLIDGSFISTDALGLIGDGGAASVIVTGLLELNGGGSYISSDAGSVIGNAGGVSVQAGVLKLVDSYISSDVLNPFDPDDILPPGTGDAGEVSIDVANVLSLDTSSIRSDTGADTTGDAGAVGVSAGDLRVANSTITSNAFGAGQSQIVDLVAGSLSLVNTSLISTSSVNPTKAGDIFIASGPVLVTDSSLISSSNSNTGIGDAGSITISADDMTVSDGGQIRTNSLGGVAGDIDLSFSPGSVLLLTGTPESQNGTIETTSIPGRGGVIRIGSPVAQPSAAPLPEGNHFAIVSSGGTIRALNQERSANVQIETDFFIRSADQVNIVAVDGSFLLEAQVDDVSSGAVARDLVPVDASAVLRGQCQAQRATGQVSQFSVRQVGPYMAPAEPPPAPATGGNGIIGGCQ